MRELHLTPQARKVLRHLELHGSISPLKAVAVYGINRLAARIYELRNAGYDILRMIMHDEADKPYGLYIMRTVIQ
jgi:Helix-turn-helix domain